MSEFVVDIIARDEKVYSGDADYLLLPGWDGETGVLANHTPFIGMLRPGLCRLNAGEERHLWAMSEGFVSISGNVVTVAVAFAYRPEEIDVDLAKKLFTEASEAISGRSGVSDTDDDYIKMLRAKVCIHIAETYGHDL